MLKTPQKIVPKDKYISDKVMSRLLECNLDIRLINHNLKYHGSSCLALEEIGLILGISKERVRQIEKTAIKKLMNPKIGRTLRGYMEI